MSDEVWVPEWENCDLGYREPWATYDTIKFLWHTWEGTNWDAAESSFRPYPPHAAFKSGYPVRQYVPLNHRAYALAGTTSERDFVIQIELAGFAEETRYWPDHLLEEIAVKVLIPVLKWHDVPGCIPDTGFCDTLSGVGILASPHSRIRMSPEAWDGYSGHVGHQHAPAPDEHWDPGALDVARIIDIASKKIRGVPDRGSKEMICFMQEPGGPVFSVNGDQEIVQVYNFKNSLHWLLTDIWVAAYMGTLVLPPPGAPLGGDPHVWICETGFMANHRTVAHT